MSNPFAAALEILKEHIEVKKEYRLNMEETPSCEAAIRVLEAAGKVDKDKAMRTYGMLSYGTGDHIVKKINSLLAALPDKEKT